MNRIRSVNLPIWETFSTVGRRNSMSVMVECIEAAAESGLDMASRKVMTSKYCIKYQLDA